jgi:hypothetical protein
MPIEFACQCGKKHQAAEEHAGKRAKCNKCGQIVTIPTAKPKASTIASLINSPVDSAPKNITPTASPKAANQSDLDDYLSMKLPLVQPAALVAESNMPKTTLDTSIQSGGQRCPSCHNQLSSAAILCINCGYNLNTGRKTSTLFCDSPPDIEEAPKKRPQSRMNRFLVSRLTSWKLWSGLGMMILAGAWWYFGMQTGSFRVCRRMGYMLVLFITGGISFINGLFDGDNV